MFEGKNSMQIRLQMAELGWHSKDRLSDLGWGDKVGYSIWFTTHEWHGRNTYALTGHEVCFHRHTNNLDDIDGITKLCAEQALKAYEEYIDCIPFQDARGKTEKDILFSDWNDPKVLIKGV